VQRLQIQLLVTLGWNKACRRPLHGLGYRMGISEIILVPLPKGLRGGFADGGLATSW